MRQISRLPQLQHLSLSRCSQLGDEEFFILAEGRLNNLTHLNLANLTQLSDLALGSIVRRRPPLTWLDISGCNMITENGFQVLTEGLRGLKFLGADSCPRVTDRTLRRLGNNLHQLQRLALGGCEGITDPGIYALLRGCKSLTRLELDNCPNITDAMLRCLTTWIPNNLTSLDVFDCRNLSHKVLQEVVRERPSLDIRSFYSGFNLSQQNHRYLFEAFDSDTGPGCLIL
ncbi:hypothetical protein DSO57_1014111 [Entomophthora muscae]|nr:hypothetical protein DSO57_1014111 [Entomophthora muscae]